LNTLMWQSRIELRDALANQWRRLQCR